MVNTSIDIKHAGRRSPPITTEQSAIKNQPVQATPAPPRWRFRLPVRPGCALVVVSARRRESGSSVRSLVGVGSGGPAYAIDRHREERHSEVKPPASPLRWP